MKNFKIIAKTIMLAVATMLTCTAMAQEAGYSIDLHLYNGGDHVSLRWYPQDYTEYWKGCENGFIVQRREKGATSWTDLSKLLPAPYTEFEKMGNEDDNALMVGFMSHYDEVMKQMEGDSIEGDSEADGTIAAKEYKNPESLAMTYGMALIACELDTNLAKMGALYYMDKNVISNKTYEYRVVSSNKKDDPKARVVAVDMNVRTSLPKPGDIKFETNGDKVYFEWDITTLQDVYAGYILERSEDGKTFHRVNKDPIVHIFADDKFKNLCSHRDSLPQCDKEYFYRLRGLTNFGVTGPVSNPVKVSVECEYQVEVFIDSVKVNDKNVADIQWSVKNPANQKITGFNVQRVSKLDIDPTDVKSAFTTINKSLLSPKSRSYKDPQTDMTNYYRVVAYGKKESEYAVSNVVFAHQIDSVPPAPPTGLTGEIDSAGVVRIRWKANEEPDIMAYRVFYANDSNDVFIGCSDTFLTTPYYTDTIFLGSLTNEIYYKVLALDKNFNQSELSHALKLEKPDTIPPAKAVFISVKQDSTRTMWVKWENSPSTDVQRVELYRKNISDSNWDLLQSWEGDSLVEIYEDHGFNGSIIQYRLVTYDKSNNSTPSESVPVKGKAEAIEVINNMKLTRTDDGALSISWDKMSYNIIKYYIYRVEDDKKPLLKITLPGNERTYKDDSVKKGSRYKYIVRPITNIPAKSVSTEEIMY